MNNDTREYLALNPDEARISGGSRHPIPEWYTRKLAGLPYEPPAVIRREPEYRMSDEKYRDMLEHEKRYAEENWK